MREGGGWLKSTDPLGLRLAKSTVIVTGILAAVLPPMVGVAVLTVATGRAFLGVTSLIVGSFGVVAGVHMARTGRRLIAWPRPKPTSATTDPGAQRLVGRLLVASGIILELDGLIDVADTRRTAVVVAAGALVVVGTCTITWLTTRSAP